MNLVDKLKKKINESKTQPLNKRIVSVTQTSNTLIQTNKIQSFRVDHKNPNGFIYPFSVLEFTMEFVNHRDNIVSLSCFPPFPSSNEALELIINYINENKKDENTLYFFDNIYEGHVLTPIHEIHKLAVRMNLDTSKIYYFTGGIQAQEIYDEFCQKNNIIEKINIRIAHVWERHVSTTTNKSLQFSYDVKLKDKLFLCFNRMSRMQRIALLGLMYSKNLVDKGHYSFFPSCYSYHMYNNLANLKNHISESLHKQITNNIYKNQHKLPLLLNTSDVDENANYVKDTDNFYYQSSYFSIVTETSFFNCPSFTNENVDETSVFFTEKTFKPIICKHPFILLNRPKALSYLKKMGYKTFHPFIDESYDEIENDELRLLAIINEIERLSNFTDEQWLTWQHNVLPIVEHNHEVIIKKSDQPCVFKM